MASSLIRLLIDTSALVAEASHKDKNHVIAVKTRKILGLQRIVPEPVLVETYHLLHKRIGYRAALSTLKTIILDTTIKIEQPTQSDRTRALEIMTQYGDQEFDYMDATLMALSERLNIDTIFTFDETDFRVFRPKHCDYLKLIPGDL